MPAILLRKRKEVSPRVAEPLRLTRQKAVVAVTVVNITEKHKQAGHPQLRIRLQNPDFHQRRVPRHPQHRKQVLSDRTQCAQLFLATNQTTLPHFQGRVRQARRQLLP